MRRRPRPHRPHAGLNESPSEKEGTSYSSLRERNKMLCLNESPSEKEGKFFQRETIGQTGQRASMKALPKRKGNAMRHSG